MSAEKPPTVLADNGDVTVDGIVVATVSATEETYGGRRFYTYDWVSFKTGLFKRGPGAYLSRIDAANAALRAHPGR